MTDTDKNSKESSEKPKTNLWKKGKSGNPAGRPKGSKNQLTLLKEAVLHNAEEMVLSNFTDVVEATIELAKQGDATALKILWDRIIPAKRTVEDKPDGEDKLNISINITGMEVTEVGGEKIDTNVVEAEFTEVEDGN